MNVIDTDVLIDIQRGHPPALKWFASLQDLPAIPGFVVMELIQDARNATEVRQALKLVAPLRVVWPGDQDFAKALSDFATYHHSHGIGLLDTLVAACAVGQSAVLLTFNAKHFRIIPGLTTAEPYVR